MEVSIARLHEHSGIDLAQIQEIYEASFDARGRKPFEIIVRGMADENYICIAARSASVPGEIVAFALLLPLAEMPFVLLEYLAVSESLRSQGIGTELLRAAVLSMKQQESASALIVEVEPPLPDDSEALNNRRIRFYERLGAALIADSLSYRMPDFETGSPAGLPLRLMCLPAAPIDAAQLRRIIAAIYQSAYPGEPALLNSVLEEM